VLKLPSPQRVDEMVSKEQKSAVDNPFLHEVKTSDTLYSIARQYNVTIKEIMEWNEKKDFSLIVGEKLKILRTQ
jgi:membrane-bound lytic murein transglycosylase D